MPSPSDTPLVLQNASLVVLPGLNKDVLTTAFNLENMGVTLGKRPKDFTFNPNLGRLLATSTLAQESTNPVPKDAYHVTSLFALTRGSDGKFSENVPNRTSENSAAYFTSPPKQYLQCVSQFVYAGPYAARFVYPMSSEIYELNPTTSKYESVLRFDTTYRERSRTPGALAHWTTISGKAKLTNLADNKTTETMVSVAVGTDHEGNIRKVALNDASKHYIDSPKGTRDQKVIPDRATPQRIKIQFTAMDFSIEGEVAPGIRRLEGGSLEIHKADNEPYDLNTADISVNNRTTKLTNPSAGQSKYKLGIGNDLRSIVLEENFEAY